MTLLSAADLAYMQDTQEQAMPGTVVIERVTRTNDGMGGSYESWAAVGTVIGRIYPRSQLGSNEAVSGAQVISEIRWFGTLPMGTEIYPQDRLFYTNRTWEVTKTNNDEMWQTAVRCDLESMNEERRI